MRFNAILTTLFVLMGSPMALADQCFDIFAERSIESGTDQTQIPIDPKVASASRKLEVDESVLTLKERSEITVELEQPHKEGEYGPRIITKESFETPDAERPYPITLPNGETKYVVGLSGQSILMVDRLSDLSGGVQKVIRVELYNENGHRYGGEINPRTGEPYGYALDSSTWDCAIFAVKNADGTVSYKGLAGAMGNYKNGKPFIMVGKHLHSRRRIVFDVEFKQVNGEWTAVFTNPKDILNKGTPGHRVWLEPGVFNHGYGGGPITLLNGEVFAGRDGLPIMVYEQVTEQRIVYDPKLKRNKPIPYRTSIVKAKVDPEFSKLMEEPKIILDVFKPDGTIFKAAERPSNGPLFEGGHIEVQYKGKPVKSMDEVREIYARGEDVDFQMVFSGGEYFAKYGSFQAYAKGDLMNMKPIVEKNGEVYDFTEELSELFIGTGRPVTYYDEHGQEMVLFHGYNKTELPKDISLEKIPEAGQRKILSSPVERVIENGVSKIRLKDNTGLMKKLRKIIKKKAKRNA
jgi:hypothetical protein